MAGDVTEDVTLLAHLDAQDDASNVLQELQSQYDSLAEGVKTAGESAVEAGDVGTTAMELFTTALEGVVGAADFLIEKVGEIAEIMGVAAGALIAAFQAATDAGVKYADQLVTVEFLTGLTSEASAGLIAGFEGVGISAQGGVTMIKRLQANLGALSMAQDRNGKISKSQQHEMDLLGISFLDASGNLAPLDQSLPGIIDHLAAMTNIAERDKLALQLFGRSYEDIAPLLEAGGAAFIEHEKLVKKWNDTLTDAQQHALTDYKAKVQETTIALQSFILQLAQQALPYLNLLQQKIQDIIMWWQNLSPAIRTTILHTAALVAIFGSLFTGAAALHGILGAITKNLGPLGSLFESVSTPMFVVLGVVAALVGIFFLLKYAFDHNAEAHRILLPLLQALQSIWEVLKETGHDLWMTIQNIAASFSGDSKKGVEDFAKALAGGLFNALLDVRHLLTQVNEFLRTHQAEIVATTHKVTDFIQGAWAGLQRGFVVVSAVVQYLAARIWPALQSAFEQLKPSIQQLMDSFNKDVVPVFRTVLPPIIKALIFLFGIGVPAAIQAVVVIIKVLIDIFAMMAGFFHSVVNIIGDIIHGDWGKLWQDFRAGNEAIKTGTLKIWTDLMDGIKKLWGAIGPDIMLALGTLGTMLVDWASKIGGQMGMAIGNGLQGLKWQLLHAFKTALESLPSLYPGGESLGKQITSVMGIAGYASGGVVGPGYGGGHLAMVGEGKETEVIATLSQAMRAGMVAGGNGSGQQIVVNFVMDGRVIQRQISKGIGATMRLQGATLGSGA